MPKTFVLEKNKAIIVINKFTRDFSYLELFLCSTSRASAGK